MERVRLTPFAQSLVIGSLVAGATGSLLVALVGAITARDWASFWYTFEEFWLREWLLGLIGSIIVARGARKTWFEEMRRALKWGAVNGVVIAVVSLSVALCLAHR